jgi:hypothetical protein
VTRPTHLITQLQDTLDGHRLPLLDLWTARYNGGHLRARLHAVRPDPDGALVDVYDLDDQAHTLDANGIDSFDLLDTGEPR